jgi:nucleotide-binding universal stress UspA family protein
VIVVGARGLSTVASALLGSVSNAVVHHCKRPVLVVPPADAP